MVAFTLKFNLNREGTVTLPVGFSRADVGSSGYRYLGYIQLPAFQKQGNSAWGLARKVSNSATVSTCEPDQH